MMERHPRGKVERQSEFSLRKPNGQFSIFCLGQLLMGLRELRRGLGRAIMLGQYYTEIDENIHKNEEIFQFVQYWLLHRRHP